MRRITWVGRLALLLVLALALAACSDDSSSDQQDEVPTEAMAEASAEATSESGAFNPSGPSLDISVPGQLPGCSDPDDDACPMPLELALDGEISQEGITLSYPPRYFEARVGDQTGSDVPIEIIPAEHYPFDEEASFSAYFATSTESAVADLAEAEHIAWSTAGGYNGTINVLRNETQDPVTITVVGAFELADGRAVVLELNATGKYGWDLYTTVYTQMLDSLTVSFEEDAPTTE